MDREKIEQELDVCKKLVPESCSEMIKLVQSVLAADGILPDESKRKAPKWILDIIAEEKAKWKDNKDKFGVGVRAGIESIEYRLEHEGDTNE